MSGPIADDRNHVAVYHGPVCGNRHCRARPGELLIETWNIGKASVDIEWTVSKGRVDNPDDHAGSCTRWGPDVDREAQYPEPTPTAGKGETR